MSTLRVDNIKSRTGTAVTIPSGQSLDVTGDINVTGGLEVSGSSNFNTTGIITAGQFKNTAGLGITENIVSGVITATSFVGNVTGNASGTAGGLTGTPDIAVQNITGVAATFTGKLTYEDVTNVDAIGIVTARGGVEFGAAGVGGTVSALGHAGFTGIVTASSFVGDTFTGAASQVTVADESSDAECFPLFTQSATGNQAPKSGSNLKFNSATGALTATQFVGVATGGTASGATVGVGTTSTILGVTDGATQNRFSGVLVEKASIQATNITSGSIDLAQGNVHYFTTNGSGATTAAIKYKGGNNLSSYMKVGENISISIISKPNNSEYVNAVTVDGGAVTEEWSGGTPSSASGGASTVTITTINLTRIASTGTPNSDYLVLCQATNFE